jgi:hypothetical protein
MNHDYFTSLDVKVAKIFRDLFGKRHKGIPLSKEEGYLVGMKGATYHDRRRGRKYMVIKVVSSCRIFLLANCKVINPRYNLLTDRSDQACDNGAKGIARTSNTLTKDTENFKYKMGCVKGSKMQQVALRKQLREDMLNIILDYILYGYRSRNMKESVKISTYLRILGIKSYISEKTLAAFLSTHFKSY